MFAARGRVVTAWIGFSATVALCTSVFAPVVSAGNAIDCVYTDSNHKLKVTANFDNTNVELERSTSGAILINGFPCGGSPTVTNTDSVVILAGAGHQVVSIFVGGGGFKPGFTDEPGTSDEIEISVSLGGDTDTFAIIGDNTARGDKVVMGKSSGFAVQGRINLNPGESSGIDGDVTLILGIEDVFMFGRDGTDTLSADGGSGTGSPVEFPVIISGGKGGDTLTGGNAADHIEGGTGPDIIKGGAGPDVLNSADGTNGNDEVFGGSGVDACTIDPGDVTTSC